MSLPCSPSILVALTSDLNGRSFVVHGEARYKPDRERRCIRKLINASYLLHDWECFILIGGLEVETPLRRAARLGINVSKSRTHACDITHFSNVSKRYYICTLDRILYSPQGLLNIVLIISYKHFSTMKVPVVMNGMIIQYATEITRKQHSCVIFMQLM